MNEERVVVVLKYLVAVLQLYFLATAFIIPLGLGMDAYDGFTAGANMFFIERWNCTPIPDMRDISVDYYQFQSWFTPGQYAFICALSKFASINLYTATVPVVFVFSVLGLVGFYHLFLKLGFTPVVSLVSLVIIQLQCFYVINYVHFAGADILLFGFMPWVALVVLRFQQVGAVNLLTIFLLGAAGFFLKSSFLIMYLAVLAGFVCVRFSQEPTDSSGSKLVFVFKIAATYAALVVVCWFFYLRFGDTPAQPGGVQFYWADILFPFAAPLVAAFSFDVSIDWFYELPIHVSYMGRKVDQSFFAFYLLLSGVFAGIGYWVFSRFENTLYISFFGAVYATMFVCLAALYLLNAEGVGTESRHFFFVGFLLLPALVHGLLTTSGWLPVRLFLCLAIATFLVFDQYLFLKNKLNFPRQKVVGKSGFFYDSISKDLLQEVYRIDQKVTSQKPANRLMLLPEYGPALDVKNYRTTTVVLRWINEDAQIYMVPAKGKVDELIFVSAPNVEDSVHKKRIRMLFADVRTVEEVYASDGGKIFRCLF